MDKNTWKTFIANEDDEKDIEKLTQVRHLGAKNKYFWPFL